MSVDALLDEADEVLAGGGGRHNRMACWLARTALEELVEALLAGKRVEVNGASMRSRLSCLEVAYADDGDLATRADYAWSALSGACHQHAYELTPTASEAASLIAQVREVNGVLQRPVHDEPVTTGTGGGPAASAG